MTYENNWYLLCDAHYNVMVVLDDSAAVVERIDYSAYGTPRHHCRAGLDGDGNVDSNDHFTVDGTLIRSLASFARRNRFFSSLLNSLARFCAML